MRDLAIVLLFTFLFAGCGASGDALVFQQESTPTTLVSIQTTIVQRDIGLEIDTFEISGLAGGQVVFGPQRVPKAPVVRLNMPQTVSEFRIAFKSGDKTVGVYQHRVDLAGRNEFLISDPDFIDASDFVRSISLTATNATLAVNSIAPLTITANLENDTTVEVTRLAALTSEAPSVVEASVAEARGVAPGEARLTADLFYFTSSLDFRVVGTTDINALSVTIPQAVMNVGETLQAEAQRREGEEVNDVTSIVNWSSSNPLLASVDPTGLITALGAGTVRIFATDPVNGNRARVTLSIDPALPFFTTLRLMTGDFATGSPDPTMNLGSINKPFSGNSQFFVFESGGRRHVPDDLNFREVVFILQPFTIVDPGNQGIDLFLHDISARTTEIVSLANDGSQISNGRPVFAGMNSDASRVAFLCDDPEMVAVDTNGSEDDVFLRDRLTGTTRIISLDTNGDQIPGISSALLSENGTHLAFTTTATLDPVNDTNTGVLGFDIYVKDLVNNTVTLATPRTGPVTNSTGIALSDLSADGNIVIIEDNSGTLVAGDTNDDSDVFVRNMTAGTTVRIGDNSGRTFIGRCSSDGRFVSFRSNVNTFAPVTPPDTSGEDVFVLDRQTGEYRIINVNSEGQIDSATVESPRISDDGRFAVFPSFGTTLDPLVTTPPGFLHLYVHDTQEGLTQLAARSATGALPNNEVIGRAISPDGRWLGFSTDATNLVTPDNNQTRDIYIIRNPLVR